MENRRIFLQKSGLATLGLPLMGLNSQGLFAPLRPSNNTVLKVAIMGLGSYANRVARAMEQCSRAKITGVISGTPSKI